MTKVNLWLAQYLCPRRHTIVASPYDRDQVKPADHEAVMLAEMDRLGVEDVCGICGSDDLRFEHGKLRYDDEATALRALRETEARNVATRLAIDRARKATN